MGARFNKKNIENGRAYQETNYSGAPGTEDRRPQDIPDGTLQLHYNGNQPTEKRIDARKVGCQEDSKQEGL